MIEKKDGEWEKGRGNKKWEWERVGEKKRERKGETRETERDLMNIHIYIEG